MTPDDKEEFLRLQLRKVEHDNRLVNSVIAAILIVGAIVCAALWYCVVLLSAILHHIK